MTFDRCDTCEALLTDRWVALPGDVFVCEICAPIMARIDARVIAGRLTPREAWTEFTRRRAAVVMLPEGAVA